jgi:hypothetical protein
MIKRKKVVKQNNVILSENKTCIKSYSLQGGIMYLSGKKVSYAALKPHNRCHVIPKGLYRYFKFYHKNIFFGTLLEHDIWDRSRIGLQSRGREIVKHYQSGKSKKENWKKLLDLEAELKLEYRQWVKYHKGEYKL